MAFAPADALEIAVLGYLAAVYGRVSVERLLSGTGLVNIYQALSAVQGRDVPTISPAAITSEALESEDSFAEQVLQLFCRILGSVAGDIALTAGATGGVYIAGGIVPRFPGFLEGSGFRERFEAKGRLGSYLQAIPVRVIQRQDLGLIGSACHLSVNIGHP